MLGLGISISLTPTGAGNLRGAAQMLFNDYFTRVTTDGGIVEAESCFVRAVFQLGVTDSLARDLAGARVFIQICLNIFNA